MKGNKMSAILAILIMLSGALAIIPFAHAQKGTVTLVNPDIPVPFQVGSTQVGTPYPPADTLHFVVGTNGSAGTTFWVDVDAYNFTDIALIQIGFTFNPTLLSVIAVAPGSVISTLPSADWIAVTGSATPDNTGTLIAYAWSTTDSYSWNGTGPLGFADLANFEFQVNPSVTPTYLDSIAGTPQSVMYLTYAKGTYQTILEDVFGNVLTPPLSSATVTYTTPPPGPPEPPTVTSTNPAAVTVGTSQTFTAVVGDGYNGTESVSPTEIVFALASGPFSGNVVQQGLSTTWTNQTLASGTYSIKITVWAWLRDNATYVYNMSATETQTANVYAKAVGCGINFYTQSWRYIDPNEWTTTYTGGLFSPVPGLADTFRPGDLVQLFANVTYNGAPVQGATVTFQVWDNKNNTVLVATALSNCFGLAEWDFRIPWPSTEGTQVNNSTQGSWAPTENTTLFGMWKAEATWQCGYQGTEEPPFEQTQSIMLGWDVSWGLSVTIISVTPNPTMRGPASCGYGNDTVVKVDIQNEYLEGVKGYVTATLYDNLLVPIYPAAVLNETIPVGSTVVNLPSIEIPSYAFVGIGYAVVSILSTLPTDMGTAFAPDAWTTFSIEAYA